MPWIEIVQFALIGALLLVILGTMREIVVLRSAIAAFSQLITRPPAPAFVGATDGLPERLGELCQQNEISATHTCCMVFVSSQCSSCHSLVSDVVTDPRFRDSRGSLLFIAGTAGSDHDSTVTTLQAAGFHVVPDPKGRIFHEAGIYATPSALAVLGHTVTDYGVGVDSSWLDQRLKAASPFS